MESRKRTADSTFKMPLHYPRYTKEDYKDMPEVILDRLLAEYGLPAKGDISFKRDFAIGAFLWPDFVGSSHCDDNSSPSRNLKDDSLLKKEV